MKRSRYKNRTGPRRLSLLAILGICFASAVLVALVTGLILNAVLDEETYYRLTTKPRQTASDTILFAPDLPDIAAYPYAFGDDLTEATAHSAVAVALNSSAGKYLYQSDVLNYLKVDALGSTRMSTSFLTFEDYRVYIGGIFYPQATHELDTTKRYAKEAEETAVVREFFFLGGDDLILCGLDLFGSTEKSLAYLKLLKLAVGEDAVGVAISYEDFSKDDARQIFEKLLTVCDFLALDLRDSSGDARLDELLSATEFAYAQYGMRLLLGEKQTTLIADLQKQKITDYEILK